MSKAREEEIGANWSRAEDSIAAAKMLAEGGFYDFVASRAYYAGFYAHRQRCCRKESRSALTPA